MEMKFNVGDVLKALVDANNIIYEGDLVEITMVREYPSATSREFKNYYYVRNRNNIQAGSYYYTQDFIEDDKNFKYEKTICPYCGKELSKDEAIALKGTVMCSECAKTYTIECECCGELTLTNLSYKVEGKSVCFDCIENHTKIVDGGTRRMFKDHVYVDEYGLAWSCKEARDNYHMENEYMYDYSDKPSPIFFGKKEDIKMGVELEVDKRRATYEEGGGICADELVYNLSQVSGLHYCKEDGSLCHQGVEIVTMPCSLEYHMNKFKWGDIIDTCLNGEYRSDQTGTCGLHVHVDRSYFKDSAAASVALSYLMTKFYSEIVNFTRRKEEALSDWAYIYDASEYYGSVDDIYDRMCDNRYRAINVTNSATIEFRIFKGTLNKETLFASMQLVQILCDLVKSATGYLEFEDTTWEDVCELGSKYNEFTSYLKRRGIYKVNENREIA